MKKSVILLLCLAVVLTMAACGEATPTTTVGDHAPSEPSSSTQQEPTEPTKPDDGTVDPEDPSLSAYEKEFYQAFNTGYIVRFDTENLAFDISISKDENALLVVLHQRNEASKLPTLDGEAEGNFTSDIQLLYRSTFQTADDTITCKLQEHKMVMKRSGDFTDDVAEQYMAYMAERIGQNITQGAYDTMSALMAGEVTEDTMYMYDDEYMFVSAKQDGDTYTDIRIDAYDGEDLECYFLVLEDMVQQIVEQDDISQTVAYAFAGHKLYEEYRRGEEHMRVDYIYDDADRLVRTEGVWNGEEYMWIDYTYDDAGNLIKMEGQQKGEEKITEEYTYDEAGNKICALRYRKGILLNKVEYNAKGDEVTDLEYDENGNITYGYESIFDDAGKLTQKKRYWSDGGREILKYDENGYEISRASYDAEGVFQGGFEYVYDEAGNMVQRTHRYSSGAYYVEILDAKGQTVSWMDYNAEGKLTSGYEYTRDDEGNVLKEVSYQNEERREITWDKNGSVLSNYYYVKDKAMEWELSTYNDKGQVLTFIRYDENHYSGEIELDRKLVYAYSEDGLLISMDTYFSENAEAPSFRDVYTYDEAGRQKLHYLYNSDGTLNRWDEYTYDAAGQPLTWIHYKGEGTDAVERREEWTYNADGECVSNLAYNSKGEIIMGYQKEFDASGKLICVKGYTQDTYKVTQYNEDHTYATRYVYDRQGNLQYWVELIIEGDTIVDEIYHDPE